MFNGEVAAGRLVNARSCFGPSAVSYSSITGYEVNHNDTSTGNFASWGAWQSIDRSGAA